MKTLNTAILLLGSFLFTMCVDPPMTEQSSLRYYAFSDTDPETQYLDSELSEISGIDFNSRGNILAHNDEEGRLYELNPASGEIIGKYSLGEKLIKKDFEDIAVIGDTVYMVVSNGNLYRTTKLKKKGSPYEIFKTGLSGKNDVEGLCFDPKTNALLLACKGEAGKGKKYDAYRAVYSFSLSKMKLDKEPRFLINRKEVRKHTVDGEFMPSGIAKHPLYGTFYILAARGNTLIEITSDGDILGQVSLPTFIHSQPEGITFSENGDLYISNEARGISASLVKYPFVKTE